MVTLESGDILLRVKPAGISSSVGIYRITQGQFVVSPSYSLLVQTGAGCGPVDLLTSTNLAGEDDSLTSISYQVAITFIKDTLVFLFNIEQFVGGGGYLGALQTLTLLAGESQSQQYWPDHPLIHGPALFTDFYNE